MEGVPWGLENGALESETLEEPRQRGQGEELERVADIEDAQPEEEEEEADEEQPFRPLTVPGE